MTAPLYALSLSVLFAFAPPAEATAEVGEAAPASEAASVEEIVEDEAPDDAADDDEAAMSAAQRDAERAADEQRKDWQAGLSEGFAWEFKHGTSLRLGGVLTGNGFMRVDEVQGAEAGFALNHARTLFVAGFFDGRLQAVVQPEFAKGVSLLDVEVNAQFDQNFGVRMGLYRPYFMRDFRVNIPLLALPTRGFVHDHFTTGRRLGVAVEGQPLDGRLEYAAGVYNGNGGEFATGADANAMFMARVAVNPLGPTPYTQTPQVQGGGPGLKDTRLSIGMNVATERAPLNDAPPEGTKPISSQQTTFAADATLMHPKGWVSLTGIRRWHRSPNGPVGSSGGYLMGGVPLGKTIFDLTGRTGVVDRSEGEGKAVGQHEAALNAFVAGNNLRATVAYLCERERGFGPGCATHSFTVQARLAF